MGKHRVAEPRVNARAVTLACRTLLPRAQNWRRHLRKNFANRRGRSHMRLITRVNLKVIGADGALIDRRRQSAAAEQPYGQSSSLAQKALRAPTSLFARAVNSGSTSRT